MHADDCGTWKNKTSTTTCTSYVLVNDSLLYVLHKDTKYCTSGPKGIWHTLSPHPQAIDIVKAHHHFATLQANDNYRKHTTHHEVA